MTASNFKNNELELQHNRAQGPVYRRAALKHIARDPRKEFFRWHFLKKKKKYFDQGIREHFSEEYFMVGLIMGKAPCISWVFVTQAYYLSLCPP